MATLTIYLTDHGRVGHAYVGLTDDNGNTEYYGYYPQAAFENEQSASNFFGRIDGPGIVADDQNTFTNFTSTPSANLELTKDQFENVQQYIEAIQNDPGQYNVGSANCVDFANNVLQAAEPAFDIGDFYTSKEMNDNNLAGAYANVMYGDNPYDTFLPMPTAAEIFIDHITSDRGAIVDPVDDGGSYSHDMSLDY